jgi:hyperosmotically inducible periplasmic protein
MLSRSSALATLLILAASSIGAAQAERAVAEAMSSIFKLRDFTVFDWIGGRYDRGTLTLEGFVRTPSLKQAAEETARKAEGIDTVVNNLEVLPSHTSDDNLRIRAYAAIYTLSALERYGPTGTVTRGLTQEIDDALRFGLDGTSIGRGPHGIHIIVSGGRVILNGVVRNNGDRQIAEATMRSLPGVLSVSNQLTVK